MKNFTKIMALSAILGTAVIATPAQAWGGWSPWSGGGPWGGGYPGGWGDDWWDYGPFDGNGWGDMTFSTSVGGRGYGRGRGSRYYGGGPWGGYGPYYGRGGPWGYGGGPWGGRGYDRGYYDDYYDAPPRRRPPPRRSRDYDDEAPAAKDKD